jgi:hypothetical protein
MNFLQSFLYLLITLTQTDDYRYLTITDQSVNRIIIVNTNTRKITWQWKASTGGVHVKDTAWFGLPSDVKPVYNNTCLLLNASKGGVALVRIADNKTIFYAYAGGNTHSAELLPDGNIVTASSTENYLTVFHTDTVHFPENVYSKRIKLPFAHNVVWDKKRNLLWSAAKNKLYSFKYNFNCKYPDLSVVDSMAIPDDDAHDLFPVFGKDSLWLTTPKHVLVFVPATRLIITLDKNFTTNIKSVSSGDKDYPVAISLPKEQWWTDEVLDDAGKSIYKLDGLKIYKVRWLLPNSFSYPANDVIKICR